MNSDGGLSTMAMEIGASTAISTIAHSKPVRDGLPEFASTLLASFSPETTGRICSSEHAAATAKPATLPKSAPREGESPSIADDLVRLGQLVPKQGNTGEVSEIALPENGPVSASAQLTSVGAGAFPEPVNLNSFLVRPLPSSEQDLVEDLIHRSRQLAQPESSLPSSEPNLAHALLTASPNLSSAAPSLHRKGGETKSSGSIGVAPVAISIAPIALPVLAPIPTVRQGPLLAKEGAVSSTPESSSVRTAPEVGKDARTAADAASTTKTSNELAQAFNTSASPKSVGAPGQLGSKTLRSDLGNSEAENPGGIELVDKTASAEIQAADRQVEAAAPRPAGDAVIAPEMAPLPTSARNAKDTNLMPGKESDRPLRLTAASPLMTSGTVTLGPSLVPHPGEATRVESVAGASGEGHGFTAGEVLTRMDGAEAVSVTRLPSHTVAVGVDDPDHGWIEVRAQGVAGQVTASLNANSPDAHAALHAQLPAMAQYLAEHDLGVRNLAVSSGGASFDHGGGSLSGGGFGGQGGSGSSSSTHGNPDQAPSAAANRVPRPGFGEAAGRIAGEPSGAAMGESVPGAGRLLSVRA